VTLLTHQKIEERENIGVDRMNKTMHHPKEDHAKMWKKKYTKERRKKKEEPTKEKKLDEHNLQNRKET